MAATTDRSGIEAGIGVNRRMPAASQGAERQSHEAPDERERRRLDEELEHDLAARGAERLPHADLAGAFGHRDHHDRDDADTAHHQADARERDHRDEEASGDLVEGLDHAILGDDREIIGLRWAEAALHPERRRHLVLGVEQRGPFGGHHRHVHPSPLILGHLGEHRVRNHDPELALVAENRAGLGVNADHPERLPEHLDRPAERVAAGKKHVRELLVDHGHERAGRVFRRRERPAREDVSALHAHPARPPPRHADTLEVDALEAHRAVGGLADAHVLHRGDERGQRTLVIVDIALPRDIDPAVREVPGIFLYDIDNLQEVVHHNTGERQGAAAEAEKIVLAEARGFRRKLLAERVVPTIIALRNRLDEICRQELGSFREECGPFSKDQDEVLQAVTSRMMQRIAGSLARELKELPERVEQEQMTAAVQRLFHLETPQMALAGAKI